jgi:hypothetical protein
MKTHRFKLLIVLLSLVLLSCSRDEPFIAPAPPVVLDPIKLNEIYSNGSPDWIELYNPNSQSVDITGYLIYDDGVTTKTSPFPTGTVIAAKGFLTVACDDGATGGNFKLSSSGERVILTTKAGVVADSITFPALATDQSYSRVPDGSGAWVKTGTVTKGVANIGTVVLLPIVLNEIAPNESPDWFEIYNPNTTASVDISGYKYKNVTKLSDATKIYATYTFPAGTVLAAKGYLSLDCDGTATTSREKLGSTAGEKIGLFTAADAVIDTISFPAGIAVGSAYARVPDGSAWKVVTTLTKGKANQ